MTRQLFGVVAVLVFASAAIATPSIDAGTIYVDMDSSNWLVKVYATGGDAVQGMEFNITLGIGGPVIVEDSVDVITGTIFDGNNGGGFDGYGGGVGYYYEAYMGVVTASGTVAADGLIATFVIDATGVDHGEYIFNLANQEGNTTFTDLVLANLTNGVLRVAKGGNANAFPDEGAEDYKVDIVDLAILAANYGTTSGMDWTEGDFNGDGKVDIVDLAILAGNYGYDATPVIPEPASLSLLAVGGFALLRRKR